MSKVIQIQQKQSNVTLVNLGLIISLGNCCIGYTGVCLSALQHLLRTHNKLSQNETMYHLSIATSSLNLGAIIGALIYKRFQEKFGTLKSFTIVDILCILFISLQLIDLNVQCFAVGRFLYGIFMTISLAMTPSFLNKMSKVYDPSIRGTLGSFNQLLIVFGIILAYLTAYILPHKLVKNSIWAGIKWRIYIGLPILFILIRLYSVYTRQEYKKVQENMQIQSSQYLSSGNFLAQQKQSYRKRLIVGILVIASNQLSCINGIFFYARQMMDLVTDNNEDLSKILMLFLAFGQLLACMMGGKLLNKFGRKGIFIKGQIIIVVILAVCFFLDMKNPYLSQNIRHFFMGILINLHVIVFNLTLGPICIFYCSQILDDLKYIILTLKCFSLFFALTSDIMIHKLGIGLMFMIFAILSLFVNIYLSQNMQETLHLEKQQIYDSYLQKKIKIALINQPQNNPLKKSQKSQKNGENNTSQSGSVQHITTTNS